MTSQTASTFAGHWYNIDLKSELIPSIILILREMTRVSSGANLDQEELTGESLP